MEHTDPLLGQFIKGYQLLEVIGEGGMGRVYRAEHPTIGKRVAFKILHPSLAADPLSLERFFREARAVNAIQHDNIIDIVDLDRLPTGEPFLLMEYLDGESLDEVLDREAPFPLARIGHVGLQICAALSAAHRQGVIHRDLKPENVFLLNRPGRRDFVKLLDFGIAKLLHDEGRPKTQAGVFVGTPLYVAPEQLEGHPVDQRADIYSFGVLLYWMGTGHLPFDHENPYILAALRAVSDLPPPRSQNPDLSPEVEAIIIRCMAVAREDRYRSMRDVARALAEACSLDLSRYLDEPGPSPRNSSNEAPRAGASGRLPSRTPTHAGGELSGGSASFVDPPTRRSSRSDLRARPDADSTDRHALPGPDDTNRTLLPEKDAEDDPYLTARLSPSPSERLALGRASQRLPPGTFSPERVPAPGDETGSFTIDALGAPTVRAEAPSERAVSKSDRMGKLREPAVSSSGRMGQLAEPSVSSSGRMGKLREPGSLDSGRASPLREAGVPKSDRIGAVREPGVSSSGRMGKLAEPGVSSSGRLRKIREPGRSPQEDPPTLRNPSGEGSAEEGRPAAAEWRLAEEEGTAELPHAFFAKQGTSTKTPPPPPEEFRLGDVREMETLLPARPPSHDAGEAFTLGDVREMETLLPGSSEDDKPIAEQNTRIYAQAPAPSVHDELTRLGAPRWWDAAWVIWAALGAAVLATLLAIWGLW